MRISRVSAFFPEVTQQIHSLRASGVISSHTARAVEDAINAFRKSSGILCSVPEASPFMYKIIARPTSQTGACLRRLCWIFYATVLDFCPEQGEDSCLNPLHLQARLVNNAASAMPKSLVWMLQLPGIKLWRPLGLKIIGSWYRRARNTSDMLPAQQRSPDLCWAVFVYR